MRDCKKAPNAAITRMQIHKTKNYTVMSNYHLFDKPPLSLKAKGLMSLFLALPVDWNYSIEGLVAISKESRDCIKATLNELKFLGYLKIEKIMPNKTQSGRIEYVYHVFEKKQGMEKPPLEFKKQKGGKQALEIQIFEKQTFEKPIQLNTNNKNIKKLNINNEDSKSASAFDAAALFNLYKNICVNFTQPRELNDSRIKKADKRLKKKPTQEFWEIVFNKAEKSDFCRSGNWFNFDWIIKNDENALKVYEGNYDNKSLENKNQKTETNKQNILLENAKKIANRDEAIDFAYKNIADELKKAYKGGTFVTFGGYDWINYLFEKFNFDRKVIDSMFYEEIDGGE